MSQTNNNRRSLVPTLLGSIVILGNVALAALGASLVTDGDPLVSSAWASSNSVDPQGHQGPRKVGDEYVLVKTVLDIEEAVQDESPVDLTKVLSRLGTPTSIDDSPPGAVDGESAYMWIFAVDGSSATPQIILNVKDGLVVPGSPRVAGLSSDWKNACRKTCPEALTTSGPSPD